MIIKEKAEILSPAGDFERLIAAIEFGADAVYLAGKEFGMRASQTNFDKDTLPKAVEYAHKNDVKVYVTLNTIPRNDEMEKLPPYLKFLQDTGVDAVIVADIGVLSLVRKYIPQMEIHISTQAGVVNYQACLALYEMGARRVVLAREVSLEEISEIRANIPDDMDIEVFVHGAMCMAFSGRCLISNYLTGRNANRGECSQPCRWEYHLVEGKRPDEQFPIMEDEKGTYILNSKDLCMIPYIDKLIKAGVTSLKIEGRAKSAYYVSVVTNAYKIALDSYYKNPDSFVIDEWLIEEVEKVSHRQYCTGFYFDEPGQYYKNGGYTRAFDVIAVVTRCEDGYVYAIQKNKFLLNDEVEVLEPKKRPEIIKVEELYNDKNEPIDAACNPLMEIKIKCNNIFSKGAIIRKEKKE